MAAKWTFKAAVQTGPMAVGVDTSWGDDGPVSYEYDYLPEAHLGAELPWASIEADAASYSEALAALTAQVEEFAATVAGLAVPFDVVVAGSASDGEGRSFICFGWHEPAQATAWLGQVVTSVA